MTKPLTANQRGLQFFNGALFQPDGVTTGGRGLGGYWTTGAGVTVTHATPASALDTCMRRTIYTNVITTADQEVGLRQTAASDYQYWFGNAALLGGFYFSAIFRLEAWDASDDGRLFVGLSASANAVVASDTPPANTIGLFHRSTDTADVLNCVRVTSGGAATYDPITTHADNSGILATGTTFIWEMWATPFGIGVTNTNYKLSYFDTSLSASTFRPCVRLVTWSSAGGGPATNAFMAPQVQASNAALTSAGVISLGIANIYVTPHSGENEIG